MKKMMVLLVVFAIFGMSLSVQAEADKYRWEYFLVCMEPEEALDFALFLEEEFPSEWNEAGPGALLWNSYVDLKDDNGFERICIRDYSVKGEVSNFNFGGMFLSGVDFSEASLSCVYLTDAILLSCNFNGCTTKCIYADGAIFLDGPLTKKEERISSFNGAHFDFCGEMQDFFENPTNFSNVNLRGIKITASGEMKKFIFQGCDFEGVVDIESKIYATSTFIGNENLSRDSFEEAQRLERVDNGLLPVTAKEEELKGRVNALLQQITLLQQQLSNLGELAPPPIPEIPELPAPVEN